MAEILHLCWCGRSMLMKKRSWIWILVILVLLVSACQGDADPSDADMDVVVATFTSTPFVDMADLAALTHTATITPTDTLTPFPSATATQSVMTATQAAAAMQSEMTATQQTTSDEPDNTPSPTLEATVESTPDSVNTEIPEGSRYFSIQEGAPIGMPNWANQEVGCAWLGLAGQVFDLEGEPVLDLIVEVGGTLEGQPLLGLSITGMASVYGPGGYEIQLADHVVASQGEAWAQIKNGTGETLSGRIFIETFDDCAQNLLLLNFVEVEEIPDPNQVFLPLIVHQDSD